MKKNPEAPVNEAAAPEAPAETTKKAFSLPYKVTCSKCGAVKAVRHEVLLKRLATAKGATLEERFNNHIAGYKCQACKREDKVKALEAEMALKQEAAGVAQ